MSPESESILGEIPVVARLALGIEQLILFVTGSRIIVAHLGKRGAGQLVTSALFGRLSGGFEDVVRSGGESRSKRTLERLTPNKILAANKDNFQVRFDEIVSLRVTDMTHARMMSLVTRDEKFDLRTGNELDSIVGLLQTPLASRLSVEKLRVYARSIRERRPPYIRS